MLPTITLNNKLTNDFENYIDKNYDVMVLIRIWVIKIKIALASQTMHP